MKLKSIALAAAMTLGLAGAANAQTALFSYNNSNVVGGYGCGISGSVSLGGPSAEVVGTGWFDPSGKGTFSASTLVLNIGGVGTCSYSLATGGGTYNISSNGTGLAQTLYNLQSGSAAGCPAEFGGTLSFVCSEGQFPLTCNIATIDPAGASLLSGTCKKQFPLQLR